MILFLIIGYIDLDLINIDWNARYTIIYSIKCSQKLKHPSSYTYPTPFVILFSTSKTMVKLSVKFAFVALLAVACCKFYCMKEINCSTCLYIWQYITFGIVVIFAITIQSVEANRLLPEQTPVVHYEASPQVVKPQDFQCREGCHVSCIPIQLVIRCVCICWFFMFVCNGTDKRYW